MKLATIVLMTSEGHEQWAGSLRDYFYANDYSRSERHDLCQRIRDDMNQPHGRPEPTIEGGGAAGEFYIAISA